MNDHSNALTALQAFLTDPTDAHAEALRSYLASDVAVSIHTTNETGASAAIAALQESLFHHVVYGGSWKEPHVEGALVTLELSMPAKGIAAGCNFRIEFNKRSEFQKIEGEWILPPEKLTPEPVNLSSAMRARINSAEDDGMRILLAYVTPDNSPEQIYRPSIHTYDDDKLALWNPQSSGSFLSSISANPQVSLIYRHDKTHEMLEMIGRAKLISDEGAARRIYETHLDKVRAVDPERTGVALVIELDRVTGLIHAAETGAIERILMSRSKGA